MNQSGINGLAINLIPETLALDGLVQEDITDHYTTKRAEDGVTPVAGGIGKKWFTSEEVGT